MASKEFALMKFNILTMALHPELGRRLDNAYIYAWDNDVFPVDHSGAAWHQPFEDEFEVTKEMMEELVLRLDKIWNFGQGTAPTFYELERLYGVREGGGAWERYTLIRAMRYLALSDKRLDSNFFAQVTRNSQAPTEANGFADPFDRERDIYFM